MLVGRESAWINVGMGCFCFIILNVMCNTTHVAIANTILVRLMLHSTVLALVPLENLQRTNTTLVNMLFFYYVIHNYY